MPAAGAATERPVLVGSTPQCPSQVVAIDPDGTVHCVPATPAAQALVGGGSRSSSGTSILDMFGLPFTGTDLAAAAGIAAMALAAGIVLRSRAGQRRHALADATSIGGTA